MRLSLLANSMTALGTKCIIARQQRTPVNLFQRKLDLHVHQHIHILSNKMYKENYIIGSAYFCTGTRQLCP